MEMRLGPGQTTPIMIYMRRLIAAAARDEIYVFRGGFDSENIK